MVVDAEMGMGLDLSRYECLWQDNGDPLGNYMSSIW